MMSAEATTIKLTYQHAFVNDELRQTDKSFDNKFNTKQNEDLLTEIKTCVINTESKLTVIGQSNGKIIYWRPSKIDNNNNDKLICYQFDGHINASIHSLCYGMCDIMDNKYNKYGLIISGGTDSKIKIYDPWHRQEKAKLFPILELNKHHNGTILCLNYSLNLNQLISTCTDSTVSK
eukprot:248408_1